MAYEHDRWHCRNLYVVKNLETSISVHNHFGTKTTLFVAEFAAGGVNIHVWSHLVGVWLGRVEILFLILNRSGQTPAVFVFYLTLPFNVQQTGWVIFILQ